MGLLGTLDAHELYEQYQFHKGGGMELCLNTIGTIKLNI